MTKAELIDRVQQELRDEASKRLIGEVVDATFEQIKKAVKKDRKFTYPEFGTFTVRKRKARVGRNPKTGESIKIAASKTVGFKPAPRFKSIV